MKKTIAVLYGGKTAEHDVSIITGIQLMDNADKSKYDIVPVYIARNGQWFTGEKLRNIEYLKTFDGNSNEVDKLYISPVPGIKGLLVEKKAGLFGGSKTETIHIDAVIPAMHGMNGEDGTLQGLFQLAEIPYACTGITGSAVGMDKIIMKSVFKGCGFPVIPYINFTRTEWNDNNDKILDLAEKEIGYPMIVKPSNLGSSIGISKAKDRESLKKAVNVATFYDRRLIIEHAVEEITEVNCSCLGFEDDIKVSELEEPVTWESFLTFEEKYMRGSGKSEGMASLDRRIPAQIAPEMAQEVKELSKKVFAALDCKGIVRIDYIIDKSINKLYVNEINTLPGSFAFYLWEPIGVKYETLIDEMIDQAFIQHKQMIDNNYAYDSDILNKMKNGSAKLVK